MISPALKEPGTAPARAGDIKRSCLEVTRAGSVLGWRPEVEIAEGLKRTALWRLGREAKER